MKYRKILTAALSMITILSGFLAVVVTMKEEREVLPSMPPRLDTATIASSLSVLWTLAGACTAWFMNRRGRRGAAVPSVLMACCVVALAWLHLYAVWLVPFLFLLTVANAAFANGKITATVIIGLGGLAQATLLYGTGLPDSAHYVVGITLLSCGTVLWAKTEFQEWDRQTKLFEIARQAASQLADANTRMQDNVEKVATVARLRERVHVAREIHDSVGHTLTGVLVQLRAAQEVLKANPQALLLRLEQYHRDTEGTLQDFLPWSGDGSPASTGSAEPPFSSLFFQFPPIAAFAGGNFTGSMTYQTPPTPWPARAPRL
jgi:hypothetical protein